ncbi:MAG: hypothetical protein HYY52_00060 [Candidatus Melainabacteria bacterium]|nr:hypothetical protein [Candidatus Melainabacteria bacterium]
MYKQEIDNYSQQIQNIAESAKVEGYSKYFLLSRVVIFEGFLDEMLDKLPNYERGEGLEEKINSFKNKYKINLDKEIKKELFACLHKLNKLRRMIVHGDFNIQTNFGFCYEIEKYLKDIEYFFNCSTEDVSESSSSNNLEWAYIASDLRNLADQIENIYLK